MENKPIDQKVSLHANEFITLDDIWDALKGENGSSFPHF